MVNRIKRRFFFLVIAVLALSAVLSVAGHVVDAAIGRGQAQSLAAQLLGGPQNNWVPRKIETKDEYRERMQRLRDLGSDTRYVHTYTHIFDPLSDATVPDLGAFKTQAAYPSKRGGNYYIVQFEGEFWDAGFEQKVRETGAEVMQALPVNAMLVRASSLQAQQIASFSETRWQDAYSPAYRLDPQLLALVEGENEGAFLDDKGSVRLLLSFFPGERPSDYAGEARAVAAGGEVIPIDDTGGLRWGAMEVRVDARALPGILQGLSRLGGLRNITAIPNSHPLNATNSWVHQTYDNNPDPNAAWKLFANGVVGFDQIIAVVDTGLENDMCYFRWGLNESDVTYAQPLDPEVANGAGDPLANITNPCNKVIAYYLSENAVPYDPKGAGSAQHGTFVTSTIAGDNFRTSSGGDGRAAFCQFDQNNEPVLITTGSSPGVFRGDAAGAIDGLAPGAQLVIQDRGISPGDPLDIGPIYSLEIVQSYDSGARYQNASFGDANQPTYTDDSESVDDSLFFRRDMNIVWAVGNTGDQPPPTLAGRGAVAKNVITAGWAIDDGVVGAGMSLDTLSSRGPTTDGRLKPDLVARGDLTSATSDNPTPADPTGLPNGDLNCEEDGFSEGGSSYAAAAVTGMTALVGQYFRDGYYPAGVPTRGRWAIPGLKEFLNFDGRPLQTDPNVNPNADRCTTQPELCDPGSSFIPTNALVKAVLLNSTRNLLGSNTGGQPGTSDARPNNGQGWGLPVLDDALFFEGDVGTPGGERSGILILTDTPNGVQRQAGYELLDNREDIFFRFEDAFGNDNPTEIKEWDVTILPGEPLVVTMCATDPGEAWAPGEVLRNDLDLEVIGPKPGEPSVNIAWRPNPDVAYTGPTPTFVRDGWVQTDTLIDSGEANIWLGKDGAPIPPDKSLWPDFASADRFNNCEQIAIRASEVEGGTYTIRILNWDIRSTGNFFTAGVPDFEFGDDKGDPGVGTDNVELDEQGFALILTGSFATTQGVISFNQSRFDCTDGQEAQITLRDQNGCADPNPRVRVTTNTPSPSFPADYEIFDLVPEFPCDPGLPADDEAQPKVWRTARFVIEDTADPIAVIQGDGTVTLVPGFEMRAEYIDVDPAGGRATAKANLSCLASFVEDGFVLNGGCDLANPGQPEGPTNPKQPDQFLDAGELVEYTVFFVNTGTTDYNDVHATMSLVDPDPADGPEATILNNPVYVGRVPAGRRASATFLVQMASGVPVPIRPQERIPFEIALTSPADNLTQPVTFQQIQKIESDIQIYTYNTSDPRGTRFRQGGIEHLRPGRTLDENVPEAYWEYDDMLVDPGPDGNYDTPPGTEGNSLQGDDAVSLNDTSNGGNFEIGFGAAIDDPWDFDDDEDGWITYTDSLWDQAMSEWFWAGSPTDDQTQRGGCGWSTFFEEPVGDTGIGIWKAGMRDAAQQLMNPGVGPVHPSSVPVNLGPDPDRAFDDIFTAPNNNPVVCGTYKKIPENSQPLYLWYIKAPRVRKVTRSTEFTVAWQRFTWYGRLFGHRTQGDNYSAFALMLHNEPLPNPNYEFDAPEYFNGIFATSAAGPQPDNPITSDWTDLTDNQFSYNLARPSATFTDRTFEDVYGPPDPDGWEISMMWWVANASQTFVPNRYGWGVDDIEFIWNESRETDDQTDCGLTVQEPTVFFAQQRYNLCEGDLEISVVDPNFRGAGEVWVRVISDEENGANAEIVRLRESVQDDARYDGRIPFTVDPRRNIRGVLLVTAGQNDTAQGADTVFVQYDPREPQDNSIYPGVGDYLDQGYTNATCNDGPDDENDDYRLNCTGDPMDALSMSEAPDNDGDGCPDGDGVPDAEDDCDSVAGIDEAATGQDCSAISDACPAGGIEANDSAFINCPGGGVFFIRHEFIDIDGDGDNYADRNEELYLSLDLLNLRGADLEDATVRITTESDNICILKDESYYGTIIGVTNAALLGVDRVDMITSTPASHPITGQTNYFRVGVPPETITATLDTIQRAKLRVDIYAENFSTSGTGFDSFDPITLNLKMDLDVLDNGTRTDFFETFCDDSGGNCAAPFDKPQQPWYTQPEFWGDPGAGVLAIDATQLWPDNGGFCPECDFFSDTQCSTTLIPPGGTEPPCELQFDGSQGEGQWHMETAGAGAPDLGTTHTGQWAVHWGDDNLLSYANTQLSALVLPELHISQDPSVTPELRFWQIAEFWEPNFTSGLRTPIGTSFLEINDDTANQYPETSWKRLDPWQGNYSRVTDALTACRGKHCERHHPTFASVGNWDETNGANGTTPNGVWVESIVDLSDWRGQSVRMRWGISVLQDIQIANETNRGWTIDDILVTGLGNDVGIQPEQDPLPGPGPCGLVASFEIRPEATCLSSAVQFADTHLGLGLSDGGGGREPIAYEWDFDGDGTPEISCADSCLEGEDIGGRADVSSPAVLEVQGNCESPLVLYEAQGNFSANMTLCQAGQVQDSFSLPVRVRPDLAGNVTASLTPLIAKGDPGCPATAQAGGFDLNADGTVDAADDAIYDSDFVGCVPQNTRVHEVADVLGGSGRALNYCWSNEGKVVCGDRSGENFFSYETLGTHADFVTVVDNSGGCAETVPLGVVVVPGARICVGNVTVTDSSCGDATENGFVESGEYVRVEVEVENCGDTPLVEPVGELRTLDPQIRINRMASRIMLDPAGQPNNFLLNPGETGVATYEFLVSELRPCEGILDFNLDVYTWDRTFDAKANFTVPMGETAPVSESLSDTDLAGDLSGNGFVCDPGNGDNTSTCPTPGPSPTCCPSNQIFTTDGAGTDGDVENLCVFAQIDMGGIGNQADELNITLLGPNGQSFVLLSGNPGGDGCSDVTIDLCTSDNLGDERTVFCAGNGDVSPIRDDQFYDDFRSAFRSTDAGATWSLRVQDGRATTVDFQPGMFAELNEFRVDVDVTTLLSCNAKSAQDNCLTDDDGPIFGGPHNASGCSTVTVSWLAAIDQEDLDADKRPDSIPMTYDVQRAERASCDIADAPSVGDFASIGNAVDMSVFVDTNVDPQAEAYWYRVVATDASDAHSSTDAGNPNPDDADHWACVAIASLCPPPIAIGPVFKDLGTNQISVPIVTDTSGGAGVRLYRGNLPDVVGGSLDPSTQDHFIADGIAGNCWEAPGSTPILDDDPNSLVFGTGSYYYLAITLSDDGVSPRYIEGTVDIIGFPGNTQVEARVPPGNNDCPQ